MPTVPMGGVAEDDSRNHLVFELTIGHTAEDPVGQPAPRGNRNRCERKPAGYVSHRIHAFDAGILKSIRNDASVGARINACGFQAQTERIRVSAYGPEQHVHVFEKSVSRARQVELSGALLDPFHLRLCKHFYSRRAHLFEQRFANGLVEAP
jgi:hypothetical protein